MGLLMTHSGGLGKLQVFATPASAHLVDAVCGRLDIAPGKVSFERFFDGELRSSIEESVAGQDVYVIGSTEPPYENSLALSMVLDAARRSSARTVTCILPYAGYARATIRKEGVRESIALPLAFAPIERSGVDRLFMLDVPNRDALAFSRIPYVDLFGSVFAIKQLAAQLAGREGYQVAAFYDGGVKRARRYAELLGLPYLSDIEHFSAGSVLFVDAILDDPTDPIEKAARVKELGAEEVSVFFNHALLVEKAVRRLDRSPIDRVFFTDTVGHRPQLLALSSRLEKPMSCAPLLAEVIRRAHNGESLSREVLQRSLA